MATALPSPTGKFSQGMALLVLEGTVLAYAFCMVRGTWPPGHPWSALAALTLATVLWSGPTSPLGMTVTLLSAITGLLSAWYEGLLHLHGF